MKIVLITPDCAGQSGWSRYALDLGRALAEQGHELHAIVARTSDADWCKEYRILRQPTSYLNGSALRWWHANRVKRTLKKIQPDIVHFIAEPYALMLPLIQKGTWKTVLTIHGSYAIVPLHFGGKTRELAEAYYRRCDAIISVSEFTKKYVKEREPAFFKDANLEQKITVIHNAISLDGITMRKQLSPENRSLTVLSVSAVKKKKGYLQSIEAIAAFRKKYGKDVSYEIVGPMYDIPFKNMLMQAIRQHHLEDCVRLHGTVDDAALDKAYARADVFLLPSLHDSEYFEGFGLVFLEANARGIPVIGPATGGCPEAIKDGSTGYVCDPHDTEAIAERMADILLHHRIAPSDCRAWAEDHDIRIAVKTIEKVYRKM